MKKDNENIAEGKQKKTGIENVKNKNQKTNESKIEKNVENKEDELSKKHIENIVDKNRMKIREKIKEKIIENQLRSNVRANRIIEMILSLGFILSLVAILAMGHNGGNLFDNISTNMPSLDGGDSTYALLVSGGAILIIGELILSAGNSLGLLIFITLIVVVAVLKIFGIYQSFNRDKYKESGISVQNATDCVIASVLLINAIILAGIEVINLNESLNMIIKGIIIYDIVLTILLVFGMNIRNKIKRYYKWKVEAKREI